MKCTEIVPDDFQYTTYMDVGSAENASLHGCHLLGQCICPWMDGSRTMQELLSRSSEAVCRGAVFCYSILGDKKCTEIVPDDFQYTTYMDVGSAENAGAIFCHSILGDKKCTEIVPDDFQHTLHPWR